MVDGHDPTLPSGGVPGYLPDDPSESMRPPSQRESTTWTDPQSRLRDMLGHDFAKWQEAHADPSAYVLRREVGHGTFGEVLEAVQVSLHRVVAVKRPRTPEAETESERADQSRLAQLLFHKEALTTSHLDHPNIVPVYDLGIGPDGRPLLAMKLVEGVAWNQRLQDDSDFPLIERLSRHLPVLLLVSRAVAFAHSRGIVHRDLKPSQVMVGNYGEVFLMDWGSAMAMPGAELIDGMPASNFATPREVAPNPAGTVAYMAPEQTLRTPDQLGPWTDVYLLGAILYEILTGTPPHSQVSAADAFMHAARGMVEPPGDRIGSDIIPGDLSLLCMWALSPRVEERLQTADEFVAALENWLSGANAREQSRRLVDDARKLLQIEATDYQSLEQADQLLARALTTWSENAEATRLHSEVLGRFVDSALIQSDLKLAAAQTERISVDELRAQKRRAVLKAERRAKRHQSQRRLAFAASLLLLVCISALWLIEQFSAENDRIMQARQAADRRLRELAISAAKRKQGEETFRAEQQGRLGELRDLTTSLINEASRNIPVPSNLTPTKDWSWNFLVSQKDLANELAVKLSRIAQLRQQCTSDGLAMSPKHFELLMAEGTVALQQVDTSVYAAQAYDNYSRAAASMPQRIQPYICMTIAAVRANEFTSATSALEHALARIETGTTYFDIVAELREDLSRRTAAQFRPKDGDVIVEAWTGGQNASQFLPMTDNWADTPRLGAYKSCAPGLSGYEISSCKMYRMYEPFTGPKLYPPVVARFLPDVKQSQAFNVYASWPARANALPVRYLIKHADGETSLALVQDGWGVLGPPNSNLWVSLGNYTFSPGADNYVELRGDQDLRPLTPQRHAELSADAIYFSRKPLEIGTTTPLLAPADKLHEDLFDLARFPVTTQTLTFLNDIKEAERQAKAENRAILCFTYYPVSSIVTHQLNRYRDYCENRLFTDPWVKEILNRQAVSVAVDIGQHPEAIQKLGINPACVSLCICDSSGAVRHRLSGDQLLLPPVELIALIQAAAKVPK